MIARKPKGFSVEQPFDREPVTDYRWGMVPRGKPHISWFGLSVAEVAEVVAIVHVRNSAERDLRFQALVDRWKFDEAMAKANGERR